jgi:hypothetical protein
MIDDMARLKQAMEQMDAEDPAEAQAAKDRAAQMLSNAQSSFSKMAELIEQRRLLLRPRIVAGIKRMDQPGMLGEAAFRDAGSALRREGQSFRQIAEAIELSTKPAPRYEGLAEKSEPLHQMASEPLPLYEMAGEPREPAWTRALVFAASVVFFPLRHPIRLLAIALVAVLLFYALRGFVSLGQQVSGDGVAAVRRSADTAMSSVGSFVNDQILRRSREATAPPTASAPILSSPAASPSPPSATPSAAPATASDPSATAPAPPANPSAPSAPPSATPASPSTAPAGPPVSPRRDARGTPPSKSAANHGAAREDRYPSSRRSAPFEDGRSGAFDDIIPERMRRKSRMGGPCVGGIGGCYWGGIHY